MAISGIFGQNYFTNAIYNQKNQNKQLQTDFAQLGQDLQSGNLTQAQSDYLNIQSLQQSMHAHSGHHHGGSGIEALLQELNNPDSSSSATNAGATIAQNTSIDSTTNTSSDSVNQLLTSI